MPNFRPLRMWTLAAAACALIVAHGATAAVTWTKFLGGFAQPVEIVGARDGSARLFVVQQTGVVRVVKSGAALATPFLDLGALTAPSGERGLLGLAFHPQFATQPAVLRQLHARPPTTRPSSRATRPARRRPTWPIAASATVLLRDRAAVRQPQRRRDQVRRGRLPVHRHGRRRQRQRPGRPRAEQDHAAGQDPAHRRRTAAIRMRSRRQSVRDRRRRAARDLRHRTAQSVAHLVRPATGDFWIGDVGQGAVEEIDMLPAGTGAGGELRLARARGQPVHGPDRTGCVHRSDADARRSLTTRTASGARSPAATSIAGRPCRRWRAVSSTATSAADASGRRRRSARARGLLPNSATLRSASAASARTTRASCTSRTTARATSTGSRKRRRRLPRARAERDEPRLRHGRGRPDERGADDHAVERGRRHAGDRRGFAAVERVDPAGIPQGWNLRGRHQSRRRAKLHGHDRLSPDRERRARVDADDHDERRQRHGRACGCRRGLAAGDAAPVRDPGHAGIRQRRPGQHERAADHDGLQRRRRHARDRVAHAGRRECRRLRAHRHLRGRGRTSRPAKAARSSIASRRRPRACVPRRWVSRPTAAARR